MSLKIDWATERAWMIAGQWPSGIQPHPEIIEHIAAMLRLTKQEQYEGEAG